MYALGPSNLGIAFAVNDTRLHTAALRFGQRVQRIPKAEKPFLPKHQLLRGRLMQTGGILNAVIAVQRILRFVAGDAPPIGCLIPLVGLQFFCYLIGNVNIFILGVPSVKVLQIDRSHYIFLRSDFCCGWIGDLNGDLAENDSQDNQLWDKLSRSAGIQKRPHSMTLYGRTKHGCS